MTRFAARTSAKIANVVSAQKLPNIDYLGEAREKLPFPILKPNPGFLTKTHNNCAKRPSSGYDF